MKDIKLDKVRLVRVSNNPKFSKVSHLVGLDKGVRYEVNQKQLLKPNGKIIDSYDLRNLIHLKALVIVVK